MSHNPLDRPSIIKQLTGNGTSTQVVRLLSNLGMALGAILVVGMFLYFIDRGRTRVEAMHVEVLNNQRDLLTKIADLQMQLRRVEERQMRDVRHQGVNP